MTADRVLQFSGAVVEKTTLPRAKKGAKGAHIVMVLRSLVTVSVIEALGIQWAFEEGYSALRAVMFDLTLKVVLVDHSLSLPGLAGGVDTYFPERIDNFRLRQANAGPEISFRVQVVAPESNRSRIEDLVRFHLQFAGQTFACEVQPRQGNLFEGGARVDMSEAGVLEAAVEPPPPPAGRASGGEGKRPRGRQANAGDGEKKLVH